MVEAAEVYDRIEFLKSHRHEIPDAVVRLVLPRYTVKFHKLSKNTLTRCGFVASLFLIVKLRVADPFWLIVLGLRET